MSNLFSLLRTHRSGLAGARYLHGTAALCKHRSSTHYYEVLQINPQATQSQIKAAFYKLSKKYHPDSNPDTSSENFHDIVEAYDVLGNHVSRRRYDRGMIRHPSQETGDVATTDDKIFYPRSYKRKNIMTGKTKHYNFDEYYSQHYGDQVLEEFRRRQSGSRQSGRGSETSTDSGRDYSADRAPPKSLPGHLPGAQRMFDRQDEEELNRKAVQLYIIAGFIAAIIGLGYLLFDITNTAKTPTANKNDKNR